MLMPVFAYRRSGGGEGQRHIQGARLALIPAVPHLLGIPGHGHSGRDPDMAGPQISQQVSKESAATVKLPWSI